MDIPSYMNTLGQQARLAARGMAIASTEQKNKTLLCIAEMIQAQYKLLKRANAHDVDQARQQGQSEALLDRLTLSDKALDTMAQGLEQIATLADPIGQISELNYRPSGIQVGKMRVPLGVIGMIYEARPNVTVDAAGLCIKSGNAVILRGGSEAIHCNQALASLVKKGLSTVGLPDTAVQVVETTDRQAVDALITLKQFVDMIVPRGGKGLIARISQSATIPVLKHLDGNCHVYIDDSADVQKALRILENSKTQRLGTCNTAESLLVAQSIAKEVLPLLADMLAQHGVEIRGCHQTCALVSFAQPATEEDYGAEYLSAIISCKVVAGLEEAIQHINHYSSQHTDAIVTESYAHARRFLREVDSSSVMVNASTRFADGFEYGLGAEIGISTDKLHARGPVGLEGLTSLKYIVLGDGHVRS